MPLFDVNVLIACTDGANELQAPTLAALRTETDIRLPFLWRAEFVNVVSKHARGKGPYSATDAREALELAELFVSDEHTGSDTAEVLDISLRFDCAGFDAEFIYWAIVNREPLITNDLKLCEKVPAHTLPLRDYLDQR